MPYRFTYSEDLDLVVIVYTGEISSAEELAAVREVLAIAHGPSLRILSDKRRAHMRTQPSEVRDATPMVETTRERWARKKIAVVVGSDHDFGMMRMFELSSGEKKEHFRVFRSLGEACAWLGLEESELPWPDDS